MALTPKDEAHAKQIQAGILGRRRGHEFEDELTEKINQLASPRSIPMEEKKEHLFTGEPWNHLIDYVCRNERITKLMKVTALSTGSLATSEHGKHLLLHEGVDIKRCKSDVLLVLHGEGKDAVTVGLSVKQCNTKSPTNAQVFCSTSAAFAKLLRTNGIPVSSQAEVALKRFCGEIDHTPSDDAAIAKNRKVDPRRYFWEELGDEQRHELALLFNENHE